MTATKIRNAPAKKRVYSTSVRSPARAKGRAGVLYDSRRKALVVPSKAGRRHKPFNYEAREEVKVHREGTKRAAVLEMLRKGGATIEEVMKANGWDFRTACEGIKLIHTHLGYGLVESSSGKIRAVRPSHK